MFAELKQQYASLLTSGGQLLLVLAGFQINTPDAWIGVLALIFVISFFAWISVYRRSRAVADTPTSKIASAAQGYVELYGSACQHAGQQTLSRITGLPCLWYRYRIEHKTGDNNWEQMENGASNDTFLLTDGSGECAIDPDGAEIITSHKDTWTDGDFRYTEWLMLPHDGLYAIGEFITLSSATAMLNPVEDLNVLLSEWKRDQPKLLERFDLDGDGQISLKEWELARSAARREVQKQHTEIRRTDNSTHVMRQPRDGRLYLLSNLDPERLSGRYTLWTWLHLFIFLAAGSGLAFMLLTTK